MRKEYYNYFVKMPAVIHEVFREKVSDYHFSDMSAVMNHLIASYIRMCDGKKISKPTRRILSHIERIPDMEFFFRRQEKSILGFEMDHSLADGLQRAIVVSGFGNRTKLAIYLICSFISSADVTLRALSVELASGSILRDPDTYLIHTYVSHYQYVFLKETAIAQRLSLEGMLTAAAELLVRTNEADTGYYTPNVLQQIIDRVLTVKGSTLKDFRRQQQVSIRTNTIGPDRIRAFMQKHNITSPREFLRRVVLFFLEARYLIYRKEVAPQEDDFSKDEQPDWEDTLYSQCQKRDFARSIYSI